MIVRKLRLRKGWSQDQLAELTDVSVRTIQRIERGHNASLETAKALAAVFEVDVTTFITEHETMSNLEQEKATSAASEHIEPDEAQALEYAKGVKDFLSGLVAYVILAIVFFSIRGFNEPILYWVFGGVGLWLLVHGLMSFEVVRLPFQGLERKLAEKKLGRKL